MKGHFPIQALRHSISWKKLRMMMMVMVMMSLVAVEVEGFVRQHCDLPLRPSHIKTRTRRYHNFNHRYSTNIRIEPAEDDFVEEDENLEQGEVCLWALKSFAWTDDDDDDDNDDMWLGAGALVQRGLDGSGVCDAWMADTMSEEVGPNLQLQGALQILDELFLRHLQRHKDNNINEGDDGYDPLGGIRTFVLQSGESVENERTCASHMAGKLRGFRPLKELLREDSIFSSYLYNGNYLDGMVLDYGLGKEFYENAAREDSRCEAIVRLLPDSEIVKRCTIKRYRSSGH